MRGDVAEARTLFKSFWALWRKYRALPEVFDLKNNLQHFGRDSPLRPELAESALHLYLATKDDHYLVVGRELIYALQNISRVPCGFASIADAQTHRLDDRMDSYFIAETLKYLFLLMDLSLDPPLRKSFFCAQQHECEAYNATCVAACDANCVPMDSILFSTEGHLFDMRHRPWQRDHFGPFASLKL